MTALQEDIARNGLKMDKENMKKAEEITDEIQKLSIKDFIKLWEEFDLVCGDRGVFPVQRVKLFELYLNCYNKELA